MGSGELWLKIIEDGINRSDAALVMVGEYGIGEWQSKEILRIFNRKSDFEYLIVPVILPNNHNFGQSQLEWYLADRQWISINDVHDDFAMEQILSLLQKSRHQPSLSDEDRDPNNPKKTKEIHTRV
ncbi:MAG: toll/interleukin-1 receptor domain-containing protein [Saprospiraceae bacterium]|nr:toll/interleukin-1 receptor domain-containing protein [Saprospiraceae bacterium]